MTDELHEMYKKIKQLSLDYKSKLCKNADERYLTQYEKSFGFTSETRTGSKNFNNAFGHFMMDIYALSEYYNKAPVLIDGYNEKTFFESKSKYNTMKQSMAYDEIYPKLIYAMKNNKKFILLILNDDYKNTDGRIIPLHKGYGLSNFKYLPDYNEDTMLWVSGDEIYKLLFPKFPKEIKNSILLTLEELRNS